MFELLRQQGEWADWKREGRDSCFVGQLCCALRRLRSSAKRRFSTPSRELRAETSRRALRGDAATMGKVAATSAPNAVPKSPSAFHDNLARRCAWRRHQTTMTFKINAADLKRME
jgi:hypothetical protein